MSVFYFEKKEGIYDKNKLVNSKVVRDKLNSVKTESAYILDDEDSEYVDESVMGGMYDKDKLKKLNTSKISTKLLELNKNKKGGDK